jgi:hypothetical protein
MAVLGKVAGPMLKDNLLRNGTDLQIDTDLVYFDVVNRRVGIYNTMPGNTLSVNGSVLASNIYINNNQITSVNGNLYLNSLSGNLNVNGLRVVNLGMPVQPYDATTKLYVDTAIATSEPNLTISDGTHIDNVGINYETLTFFGNTAQMNVWVSNNQVTFSFIPNPTVYGNLTVQGNVNSNLVGLLLTNNQPYINSLNTISVNTVNVGGNLKANAIEAWQIGNTNTILEGTIASVNSSQPNITAVGTLISLNVAGNITSANLITGNINSSYIISNANISAQNLNIANSIVSTNVNANVYTNYITGQATNGNIFLTPTGIGIVNVNSKSALQVPSGNNGEYPAFNTPGMIRWNTSYNYLEVYTGSSWEAVGLEGTTVVFSDTFTGDGSQVNFTLSQNNTTQGTLVSVNGVLQIPTTSYTVSGNVLTFAEAPISTDVIEARTYSPGSVVSGLRNDNSRFYIHTDYSGVALEKLTTIANSVIVAETTQANTAIFNTLNVGGGIAANVSNIVVNTTTGIIDSFDPQIYRTAKYLISATNTTSSYYQSAEAMIVHNGSTANISTYNIVTTNSQFFTLSANIYSGSVRLWATTTANTNFKVSNIYIPV